MEDQVPGATSAHIELPDPESGGSTSQLNVGNYLPVDIMFIPEDMNLHQHCCENLK
jgi:hypothetical protein